MTFATLAQECGRFGEAFDAVMVASGEYLRGLGAEAAARPLFKGRAASLREGCLDACRVAATLIEKVDSETESAMKRCQCVQKVLWELRKHARASHLTDACEDLYQQLNTGQLGFIDLVATKTRLRNAVKPLIADRCPAFEREYNHIAASLQRGDIGEAEAAAEVATAITRLAQAHGVAEGVDQCMTGILGRLGPGTDMQPELRLLALALALDRTAAGGQAVPTMNVAVMALVGSAVETALRAVLFEPYLLAVGNGAAAMAACLAGQKPVDMHLGDMKIPWGKLVTHEQWTDDVEIGPLASYVQNRFREPHRIQNSVKLDVIGELRNHAAHGDIEECTRANVERMLDLAWTGPEALLPALYGARFGSPATRTDTPPSA